MNQGKMENNKFKTFWEMASRETTKKERVV